MASMLRDIQMPSLGQQNLAAQSSMRDLQLQQAAATPTIGRKQAAQVGGKLAAASVEDQVKNIQAAMQQWAPSAQQSLQEQQGEQARRLSQLEQRADKEHADDMAKLGKLSSGLAGAIQKERDEMLVDSAGRKYLNERQLADFKLLTARSQQELEDYRQKVAQMSSRKNQMYDMALKKVEALLNNQYTLEAAGLDNKQKVELARLAQEARARRAKEEAKAKQRSAKNQMLGAVGSSLMAAGAGAMMVPGAGWMVGGVMMGVGALATYGATQGWGEKL